jgi:hypothetical protein
MVSVTCSVLAARTLKLGQPEQSCDRILFYFILAEESRFRVYDIGAQSFNHESEALQGV